MVTAATGRRFWLLCVSVVCVERQCLWTCLSTWGASMQHCYTHHAACISIHTEVCGVLHQALDVQSGDVAVLLQQLQQRVAAEEAAAAQAAEAAARAAAEEAAEVVAHDEVVPVSEEEVGHDSDGDYTEPSSVDMSSESASSGSEPQRRRGRWGREAPRATRASARLGRQHEEAPRRSTRGRRVSYAALEGEAPASPPQHRVRLRLRHRDS